jgi:hypothetical protein
MVWPIRGLSCGCTLTGVASRCGHPVRPGGMPLRVAREASHAVHRRRTASTIRPTTSFSTGAGDAKFSRAKPG